MKTIEEPCLSQMGRTNVSNPMIGILRYAHLTFLEARFICNCIIDGTVITTLAYQIGLMKKQLNS